MENSAPAAANIGGRREPSTDPVKAQGVLKAVTKKSRDAARVWHERWSFYGQIKNIQEEEAQKMGMSLEEYRTALRSVSCHPEPPLCTVVVDPSPKPLPPTTSGTIGRRALCPLERYGKLVKTNIDYPTRPPLMPGQLYDPYKQTLIFLGSVDGDPISYKLPPSRCEVTDDMWARPQQLSISPFDRIEEPLKADNQISQR